MGLRRLRGTSFEGLSDICNTFKTLVFAVYNGIPGVRVHG